MTIMGYPGLEPVSVEQLQQKDHRIVARHHDRDARRSVVVDHRRHRGMVLPNVHGTSRPPIPSLDPEDSPQLLPPIKSMITWSMAEAPSSGWTTIFQNSRCYSEEIQPGQTEEGRGQQQ
jgi:hypothetical protein